MDTNALRHGLQSLGLKVIVDPMHGSAAGGLPALLGETVSEIRSQRDPAAIHPSRWPPTSGS